MASFAEKTLSKTPDSTIPPSSLTPLDKFFTLPEHSFFESLDAQARRVELLTALLQANGMLPERGVRALQAALGAIVASAEGAQLKSLASLAQALASALDHLGLTDALSLPQRSLDVLVLDETEISRDLVALAVEAQGHIVRAAGCTEEFVRHLDERLPELIVTEVEFTRAPAQKFIAWLHELLEGRPVPVILFSGLDDTVLSTFATRPNVRKVVRKELGIEAVMAALEAVVRQR